MRFADSADDNDKLGGGTEKYKTKIAINSSGHCTWMSPAIFQSSCDINTEYFPFDDQVRHMPQIEALNSPIKGAQEQIWKRVQNLVGLLRNTH